MSVVASLIFTQGVSIGTAGHTLVGTVGAGAVNCKNNDNTNVARWIYTLLDVPVGSSLVPGVLLDSTSVNNVSFLPDVPGAYPIKLEVRNGGGSLINQDFHDFIATNDRSWILPGFNDSAQTLNQTGNTTGWKSALNVIFDDLHDNAMFLDKNQGAVGAGKYLEWNGTRWVASTGGKDVAGVFNVKSAPFLAKGDGVTNDTAAIQAAITAALNAAQTYGSLLGGGLEWTPRVYFPSGTYLVTSIEIPDYIGLDGDDHTLIVGTDPTKDVTVWGGYYNSLSNIAIQGGKHSVRFYGDSVVYGGSLGDPTIGELGLTVTNCAFRYPKDCTFYQDVSRSGQNRDSAAQLLVIGCSFQGPAIYYGAFDEATFIDCYNFWDTTSVTPALDSSGKPLANFTSFAGLNLVRFIGIPVTGTYATNIAWVQGTGTFHSNDCRFGGEDHAVLFRARRTINYAGVTYATDSTIAASFIFNDCAIQSVGSINIGEIYEEFPVQIVIKGTKGSNGSNRRDFYDTPVPLGFWVDSGVDTSVDGLAGTSNGSCKIDIDGDLYPTRGMKFRQSAFGDRLTMLGTDLMPILQPFVLAQIGNAMTFGSSETSSLPKNNVWYSGNIDSGINYSDPFFTNISFSGSNSDLGRELRTFLAADDGAQIILSPGGSLGDWGATVPAGLYCFSAYVRSTFPGEYVFVIPWVGRSQFFQSFYSDGSGNYKRIWFPFYHDGTAHKFRLIWTDIPGGGQANIGQFMINEGATPAPWVAPVDNPASPATNTTSKNFTPSVYYGTSVTPPSSGDYSPGDYYISKAPVTNAPSVYVCVNSSPLKWEDQLGTPVVNVKRFGAVGDGTTNDTTAVQAAVDFVKSLNIAAFNPNGTGYFSQPILHFPNGRYKCNIDVPANIKLKGDHQTQLIAYDPTKGAVNIAVYNNVIESLGIYGKRWAVTGFAWSDHYGAFIGSNTNGSTGLTIRDCNIRSSIGPQIYLNDTGWFTTLSAQALSGQPTATFTNVPPFVVNGVQLYLESASGALLSENVTVLSVLGHVVTFSGNLSNTFASGSRVGYLAENRASAAQVLVEGCELEGPSTFFGGTNAVDFVYNYVTQRYEHRAYITAPASAGQPTITVDDTTSVTVGELLAFGGPSVSTNPDCKNIERLIVQSKTPTSITFTTNLVYAHRQAGQNEEVILAPDVDDVYGFPLAMFNNTSQISIDNVATVPSASFYNQQFAFMFGCGDFRTKSTRFGGESGAVVARFSRAIAYNHHTSVLDAFQNVNFYLDTDAISSTSRNNWIECMDIVPQRMYLSNELGTETNSLNAYQSLGGFTGQIWLQDTIDLTEFTASGSNFPVYDFEAFGDLNVCFKFRQSSLAHRRFLGAGTDVTQWFRQWAIGSSYNGTQITNQIGHPMGLPKNNLWFAGHYDSGQLTTGSFLHTSITGTQNFPGIGVLSIWTASQNGYLSPAPSSLDSDDATSINLGLHNQDPWGSGMPAGEYTFSAYIKTSDVVGFSFANANIGESGQFRFPFMSVPGSLHRVWFPFYFDGTNRPSFTFATENVLKSGSTIVLGGFMINEGTEPAPYLYPVDSPTAPTTNITVEDLLVQVYRDSPTTPPSTGTYPVGSFYQVFPPQAATNNLHICLASPHTWAPVVYSAVPSGSAGGSLGGTYPNPTVVGLDGVSGVVSYPEGTTNPTIQITGRTSNLATSTLTIHGQEAYSAATSGNRVPGAIVLNVGSPTNGGTTETSISFTRNTANPVTVSWSNATGNPFLCIGTTVASLGTIRMLSPSSGFARNNANSGDVRIFATDASDNVILGDAPTAAAPTLNLVKGSYWQLTATNTIDGYLDADTLNFRAHNGSINYAAIKFQGNYGFFFDKALDRGTIGYQLLTSDLAPNSLQLYSQSAWSGASVNTSGADIAIGGGDKVGSGSYGLINFVRSQLTTGGGPYTSDTKLKIKIDGTVYYLLANTT